MIYLDNIFERFIVHVSHPFQFFQIVHMLVVCISLAELQTILEMSTNCLCKFNAFYLGHHQQWRKWLQSPMPFELLVNSKLPLSHKHLMHFFRDRHWCDKWNACHRMHWQEQRSQFDTYLVCLNYTVKQGCLMIFLQFLAHQKNIGDPEQTAFLHVYWAR